MREHGIKLKEMAHYYKYRSLQDLKRVLEILVNERIYGATYKELNDPMEGYYRYNAAMDKVKRTKILDERSRTRICSLAKCCDNGLMWSHYADNNKGCCIEVEVTSKSWKQIDVEYKQDPPDLADSIDQILKVKAYNWSYEDEIRFIRTFNDDSTKYYLEVKVTKIIFGCAVKEEDYDMYKKLVDGINKIKKKKSSTISVEKMKKEKLKYGFAK